jgi:hypothetical protein
VISLFLAFIWRRVRRRGLKSQSLLSGDIGTNQREQRPPLTVWRT